MLPESLRKRFWQDAEGRNAYVVLDGAQNPLLLDSLITPDDPPHRCLISGNLEPDMEEVAPYLIQLEQGSHFAETLLGQDWGANWGILLLSFESLGTVWRHLRQHVQVYGPELEPLYFRFYDPRVLRNFLPTCNEEQLGEFFGPVDRYYTEAQSGDLPSGHAWTLANGQLVREDIHGR